MALDVVDTGRRRRWTDAEKLQIVEESFAGPRRVAATARRNGLSRSLMTTWRRLHRQGLLLGGRDAAPGFVPVTVTPEGPVDRPAEAAMSAEGTRSVDSPSGTIPAAPAEPPRVEIVLRGGRRLIVGAGLDAAALAELIAVVEGA